MSDTSSPRPVGTPDADPAPDARADPDHGNDRDTAQAGSVATRNVRPEPGRRPKPGRRHGPGGRNGPGGIGREVGIVGLIGCLLAVLMTWPTLAQPTTTVPGDLGDPLAELWIASWGGHALLHQPLRLFDSNTFYPLAHSYAFNDTLLGFAPLGLVTGGYGGSVLRYNILYVLAFALASVGAYALARQLGATPVGAAVAGAAFAYAPWRLAQDGHLNILAAGGIPLALALLARGHGYGRGGYHPADVRPWVIVLGWLVALWQVSLGFALALTFCYVLLVVGIVSLVGWFVAGRPRLGRRLVQADLFAGGAFVVLTAALAVPYLIVLRDYPDANRGNGELALFSPPLSGFVTAPSVSSIWGPVQTGLRGHLNWPPEMTLLPGFVLLLLAVGGLLAGAAPVRRRVWLAVVVAAGVLLGMGTTFLGGHWTILPMQTYLPGWDSVRTTGRLVLWTTLALGLLAAYGVSRLQASLQQHGYGARLAVTALAVAPLLVLGEGIGDVPHPVVPDLPPAVAAVRGDGPLLVLPSDAGHDFMVMAWSTDGFPDIANGSTSVNPGEIDTLRARAANFPSVSSISYLRSVGIRTVVLLPGYTGGTPWQGAENRPYAGLAVSRRQVGNDYVYSLR